MKRVSGIFLSLILIICLLAGCGPKNNAAEPAEEKKLSIVTTIFPIYDWVKNVLGDKASAADVTMLLDSGVDLHSYQPTVNDIIKISGCDVFIYVGGESDEWVDDALKEASNKDMIVLDLLDIIGDDAKEEEIKEGMQEEDHDHGEDHEEDHDHGEETEYDEHVWLSLRNAARFAGAIKDALSKADPRNAALYEANAAAYAEKLGALDEKYRQAVGAAGTKTLLFGDRFPFRYLTDDYGLDYYAAFVGCSAETEASFETVTFLAGKVDELGLGAVMTIEGKDHRIAQTIIRNTKSKDQKIVYAQVSNMLSHSDEYMGKTVKIKGKFVVYQDNNTGKLYYACVIPDATACCQQGFEFILADERKFPEDYPAIGSEITVSGTFDTYQEGEYVYVTLRDAVML